MSGACPAQPVQSATASEKFLPRSTSTSARIDGRRLRSERTRQYIIEAYLALLREDPQVPTAAQIAERAGYSVRSLFERFPDLHALSLAAADYAFAQANAQAVIRNIDADRATRIRTQVETRGRTCEQWLPLWRALSATRPFRGAEGAHPAGARGGLGAARADVPAGARDPAEPSSASAP